MRQTTNGTFRKMEKNKEIGLPDTWARNVDEDQRSMFVSELERRYPELRLCDDHWKANSLAIECFAHFRRKTIKPNVDQPAKRKLEEDGDVFGDSDSEGTASSHQPRRVAHKKVVPQPKRPKPATNIPAVDNPLLVTQRLYSYLILPSLYTRTSY
ncbi:hypothetical protein BC629DRAFT_1541314 [Irpex lacteus]|nr:hypothetical protein BC629DRAFT_1541314 [Irpex lacteus]